MNRCADTPGPAVALAVAFVLAVAIAPASGSAQTEAPPRIPLQEAVRRALDRNPTFLVAREEIRRAQGLLEQARAQSLPTLSGQGTFIRLEGDRTFQGVVEQPANQGNLSGLVAVPLVNPRAWALWSHAAENVDVARASALDVRRTVALSTGHAYLAVFTQKRLLDANVHARRTAKAHLDFAHRRFVSGAGNRLDEVRAAQQLAADEALVESSTAAVARAQEALSVLVGSDQAVDAGDEPSLPSAPPLDRSVALATQARSDVLLAQDRKLAAHHVARDNWTEYSPYLTGTFNPFYQVPRTAVLPPTGFQAEIVLSVPIYDGGYACGLGKERKSLDLEASLSLEGTIRQARSDVRAANATLVQAVQSLEHARESARLAAEALDLANQGYEAGETTNLAVIDAELTARDAEIQAELAGDAERQARLDLLAAAGLFP